MHVYLHLDGYVQYCFHLISLSYFVKRNCGYVKCVGRIDTHARLDFKINKRTSSGMKIKKSIPLVFIFQFVFQKEVSDV